MLESLSSATTLPQDEVEVLCSWNGSDESEAEIINQSGYEFLIAQHEPYHFASNVNQLANQANGDVLALINDDVVLDASSLDAGLKCLSNHPPETMVGALLRSPNQQLQHMGFCFDMNHNPYHILEGMLDASEALSDASIIEVPAVTAAVAMIPRATFLNLRLNESYQRCGEDIELNLDLRQTLQGHVLLCPELSGVHAESATRAEVGERGNTSEDQVNMRARRRRFLEQASSAQLLVELSMANRERQLTNRAIAETKESFRHQQEVIDRQRKELDEELKRDVQLARLQKDRDHWQRQAQVLQLESLRLQDAIQRQEEA